MKFTLEWLKSHLETEADADTISQALTTIGLEVESVEDQAKALKAFVIAKIVSAEQHPNADRLRVCKVDAGTGEVLDVVCGAPNARTGLISVFAFPGTYIPGKDLTITKGNIRGAVSNGMLCSGAELGLSTDADGIIEVPDDAPIGAPYAAYAGLGNVVFDISITPNRGDCTGVYGIARDLAAYGIGKLKDGAVAPVASPGGRGHIGVGLNFAEGGPQVCKMFAGRLITGVKNGPSPDWLQQRLKAIGLRPINTLVDITNLVCYDRGRPLHVFDADKLTGNIQARMARPGESLAALDNKTYPLDESICVIADDSGALGIGGIIGGEATGCSETTTNVFLECAWFEPTAIATSGRKLGINTDARYRFERVADPEFVLPGMELGTQLIVELCGGVVHEPEIAGRVTSPNTVIDFPVSEVKRLTGLDVKSAEAAAILARLGFKVNGTDAVLKVIVPSWRPDVTQKADLAEEVMRMAGVDNVPVEPLPALTGVAPRMLTLLQNRRRLARRVLASRGLDEAMTWSFISEAEAKRFGGGQAELVLANAIASDMTAMRPSLLPGLLAAARRNENRGSMDLGLFEVGQVFLSVQPDGQHTYATAIRSGVSGGGRQWSNPAKPVDVFDAKADMAALLAAMGHDIDKMQVSAEAAAWSHPGRGGRVQLGPKVIGWFGELHPAYCEALDLSGPVVAFEIDLDAIPEPRKKPTRAKPALELSDLMPLSRDFAFVVDKAVAAVTILKAARGADKSLITDVRVFDVFERPGESKKSVAIAVTLTPRERTLTEEEIEKVSAAIVATVNKATGGVLRT